MEDLELECLLGTERANDAGFAQAECVRQSTDGEPFEALDRRLLRTDLDDRGPRSLRVFG